MAGEVQQAEVPALDQGLQWREGGDDHAGWLTRVEQLPHGLNLAPGLGQGAGEHEPGWAQAEPAEQPPTEDGARHGKLIDEKTFIVARIPRVKQLPWDSILIGQDCQLPYPLLPVPELRAQRFGNQLAP